MVWYNAVRLVGGAVTVTISAAAVTWAQPVPRAVALVGQAPMPDNSAGILGLGGILIGLGTMLSGVIGAWWAGRNSDSKDKRDHEYRMSRLYVEQVAEWGSQVEQWGKQLAGHCREAGIPTADPPPRPLFPVELEPPNERGEK